MSPITCPASARARRSPTMDVLVLKRPNAPTSDEARKLRRIQLEGDHKNGVENAQRREFHVSSRRNARSLTSKRPAPPIQQSSNPSTLVLPKARSFASAPPHTQGPLLSMFQQPTDAPATQPAMHTMTRTSCEVRKKRPVQRAPPGKPPLLLQPRATTPAKNATGTTDKRRALRRVTGDVSSVKKAARTDAAPAKVTGRDASAQANKTIVAAKLAKVAKASASAGGNIYFPPKAIQQPADSVTPPIEAVTVKRDPVDKVPAKVEVDVYATSQEKQEGSPAPIPSTYHQPAVEDSCPLTNETQISSPGACTRVPSEVGPLDLLGELRLALAKRGMLKVTESNTPASMPEITDESPARKLIDRINKLKAQRALGDITNLRSPVVQEKVHKARALVRSQPVISQHFEERPMPRPGESSLDTNTWTILTKAGVNMCLVAAQTRTPTHIRRVKSPPLRACDFPFCGGQAEHEVEGLRHMKLVGYRGEVLSSARAFGGNGPANLEDQGITGN